MFVDTVMYGDAVQGPERYVGTRRQAWTPDSPGHPGGEQANARYGAALAEGDFDGDGFDDLAIGAPGELNGTGAVYVLRGSLGGLTTGGAVRWDQDSEGIAGANERGDQFGFALAAGDFNCDGYDDLAVGVPGEDLNDITDAGAVSVIYGSDSGLHRSRGQADQLLHQDQPSTDGTAERFDRFGSAKGPSRSSMARAWG